MSKQELMDSLNELITPEGLKEWLNKPNDAFNGEKPQDLIDNNNYEQIEMMIWRINANVAS
jgi:hypothetical protein